MNQNLLKQALGIDLNDRISITKVKNGYNIRFRKTLVSKYLVDTLKPEEYKSGPEVSICFRCKCLTYIHHHHVIPKSAGGGDDIDNLIPLCFHCHVGNDGIHNGKWCIEELVPESVITMLKKRYKVIR